MVEQEVTRFAAGLPRHAYDRADLMGYAWVGLCEARVRFKPEKGVPISAFARLRVRGALIDSMRGSYGLVRRRYLERLVRDGVLTGDHGTLRGYLVQQKRAAVTEQLLNQAQRTPEEQMHVAERAARLRDAVDSLGTKDRSLIKKLFGLSEAELSGAEIADALGIHRSSVCRQKKRILRTLKNRLEESLDKPNREHPIAPNPGRRGARGSRTRGQQQLRPRLARRRGDMPKRGFQPRCDS